MKDGTYNPAPATAMAGIEAALADLDTEAIHHYMDNRRPSRWTWTKEGGVPSPARIAAFARDLALSAASRFGRRRFGKDPLPHGFCASGGLTVRVYQHHTSITFDKKIFSRREKEAPASSVKE